VAASAGTKASYSFNHFIRQSVAISLSPVFKLADSSIYAFMDSGMRYSSQGNCQRPPDCHVGPLLRIMGPTGFSPWHACGIGPMSAGIACKAKLIPLLSKHTCRNQGSSCTQRGRLLQSLGRRAIWPCPGLQAVPAPEKCPLALLRMADVDPCSSANAPQLPCRADAPALGLRET
jgi:hypothetical protein